MATRGLSASSRIEAAPAYAGAGDEKLRLDVAIGWAIGSVGTATLLIAVNLLILKYLVDYLLISAGFAGVIIAATRIFDASLDPFMGLISDRTKSRWGRRRPYLLVGGILCGFAPILLFGNPFGMATASPTLYITFALCVMSIAYTAYSVPYITMSFELTADRKERTMLMSFRVYAMSAGGMLAQSLAPWIIEKTGGGLEGFAVMGLVLGAIIALVCLTSFVMTTNAKAVEVKPTTVQPKLRDMMGAFGNKPFMRLIGAKSIYIIGTGVQASALAFFITQALDQSLAMLGLLSMAVSIAVIVAQPFWVWVCNRIGKRRAFIAAAPLNALANISWLLADSSEPSWGFIVRGTAIGLAGGGMMLCIQAMLPDVLQHESERSGISQEGVLAGAFTTVERAVSAGSVAIAGFILSLGGYVAGAEAQSAETIWVLFLCVSAAPTLGIVIGALILWGYSLKD